MFETIATIAVYLAGIAGIFGHWCILHIRARSKDSLWNYLKTNFEYTFASFSVGIGSSSTVLTLLMPGMTIQQIMVLMGSAFSAGMAVDATINKGSQGQKPEPQTIKVIPNEKDDLNDVLADDSKL